MKGNLMFPPPTVPPISCKGQSGLHREAAGNMPGASVDSNLRPIGQNVVPSFAALCLTL